MPAFHYGALDPYIGRRPEHSDKPPNLFVRRTHLRSF